MIATVILIFITSMGIYGFLSAAYQETANKAGNMDAQISLVEVKRDNIKEQLTVYTLEKENITKAIADLRAGLANNIIRYKDKDGNMITSTSTATRNALEKQLDQAVSRQTDVNFKVDELNTQLFEYETEIVEIKTGSDLAGELGPLKFISSLTGIAMDQIINVLLLVIIFVFDPLAISLVIAANFAFAQINPVKDPIVKEQQYDPLDLNKDGIVDESEISATQQKITEIEDKLSTQSLSGWRTKKLQNEINSLKSKIERDDTTKTY
jgi:predicted  nucleic acid-binding Zn-ribbon protein